MEAPLITSFDEHDADDDKALSPCSTWKIPVLILQTD